MDGLSQSAFLQGLGWATLNSFWQMALLWCCFLIADNYFHLSANKKYQLAVLCLTAGFTWFIITFVLFDPIAGTQLTGAYFNQNSEGKQFLLSAASITYLLLLLFPIYRFINNWRYIQTLKKTGLKKANIENKLFIQRLAGQIGINKKVSIFISELVKSPLTIGYLKPIILLPIASINNLSLSQLEAVLLHELAHIKRLDYLINIIISVINTLLYFNPFVRFFIKIAEKERENCCDELVLQFGYDKVSYASALMNLEKASTIECNFALSARGTSDLVTRIEKIIGIKEKKPTLKFSHFAGLLASILLIFALNSLILTSNHQTKNSSVLSFNSWVNPFYFMEDEEMLLKTETKKPIEKSSDYRKIFLSKPIKQVVIENPEPPLSVPDPPEVATPYLPVNYTEEIEPLTTAAKKQIQETIKGTKKILQTAQWNEIEKSMGEVLSETEKAEAKKDYLLEIEEINWDVLEKTLRLEYNQIDWAEVNRNLSNVLIINQLDTLQQQYADILHEIEKAELSMKSVSKDQRPLAFPDQSIDKIKVQKDTIRLKIHDIKTVVSKKVVRL